MSVMHCLRTWSLAGLTGLALAAQAAGQVDIRFTEPERFADAGTTALERERTQRSLAQYLQRLGERLPDGQTLKVEITDIDLAGWLRPGRIEEVRVLRGGADWPRIQLRYELQEAGRTVKAGEEELKDLNYMASLRRIHDGDLPYEKRLLADWFDARFAAPRTP